MSDVNKEVKQEETNSLAPIPEKDRIMGWGSNTMLWLGGCISIGTLAMGSAQMEAGLNLLQLFLAVAIGSMILVVGIAMNDQFSTRLVHRMQFSLEVHLEQKVTKFQV